MCEELPIYTNAHRDGGALAIIWSLKNECGRQLLCIFSINLYSKMTDGR